MVPAYVAFIGGYIASIYLRWHQRRRDRHDREAAQLAGDARQGDQRQPLT